MKGFGKHYLTECVLAGVLIQFKVMREFDSNLLRRVGLFY